MTTRKRSVRAASIQGQRYTGSGWTDFEQVFNTHEVTESSSNDLRFLGKQKTGGFFYNEKNFISLSPATGTVYWGDTLRYRGDILAIDANHMVTIQNGGWPNIAVPSTALVLGGVGATAIARSAPGSPAANTAVLLGELRRDGIPALLGQGFLKEKTRVALKHAARGNSSEYLNYEFGWKPLIADLRKIVSSMKRANKLVEQYRRDSSRWVRRTYEFPKQSSQTVTVYSAGDARAYPQMPGEQSNLVIRNPSLTITYSETTERKFAGAFEYFVPPRGNTAIDRMLSYEADINHLLGTRLTPEVVWNIAPWSWAADWFSNCGDVVHNMSEFMTDGLTMPYGYMMETKRSTTMYHGEGRYITYASSGPQPDLPYSSDAILGYETKIRIPASPFGFGLELGQMTARQIAISAAIGVSRGTANTK
jgi:hypothetical protein